MKKEITCRECKGTGKQEVDVCDKCGKEEITRENPMGVSQWKKIGQEYGYKKLVNNSPFNY